jgi:cobyrinic acid a,c-diamide synthase
VVQNLSIPRIIISGLRGGSGKTILSLCLITYWHKKKYRVIPFKKGPDYIDAGWLSRFAGTPCFNLDLFMMSPEGVLGSFISHSAQAQIAVIEGNRGLYDGVDHKGSYSTAQLAKLLRSPVIIIVDCTKVTNTIAAMLLGLQTIDPDIQIRGVVLNRIATGRQESLIKKAINERCNLPVLGAIPRLRTDPFPERHMGLVPSQEHLEIEKSIATVIEIAERYVDIDSIWKIANEAGSLNLETRDKGQRIRDKVTIDNSSLKIGIIKDPAFQFYYPENLEELEKRGAEIIEINALKEEKLPELDALYIGGGFPETHAIALADNINFKRSLNEAIENGLPVYAECGGLMFLGESLILNNKTYPMVGALPITFTLEERPQAHGYTVVEVEKTNPYFPQRIILKGHEFHYSKVLDIKEDDTYMAFNVKRGKGIINNKDGLCYKNVLATYTHLHALGTSEWADGLIRCAREFRNLQSY